MRIVSLSGTTLSTSRLGFGTSGLHQLLRGRKRQDLLAAAFQSGVRYFDTSPFYGHGIAERELGKFTPSHRGKLLIATKFGIRPNALLARTPWLMYAQLSANAALRKFTKRNKLAVTPTRDYSAREARTSLECSLRALRTDHVDIYFLHEPNRALLGQSDELLLALDRLRREGKTRYIGLAGAARDCIDVATTFPTMAQIMQINAAPSARELELVREAALPCHLSFGHFRGRGTPMKSLLSDAVKENKTGVVLYSSRHTSRVAEIAEYLTELEGR
jgi:aryl-alcohol dehydrogenase-like predicted oxidoreductase